MIPTLFNMGHIALEAKDGQRALDLWLQALALAQETNNAEGIFHTAGTVGRIMAQINQPKKAHELLSLAVMVGKQAGFPEVDELEELLRNLPES